MFEGYGEAAALSLIVIPAAFAKFAGVHAPVGVGVAEFVAVPVAVAVEVAVPVAVAVLVGVAVFVRVGELVGVLVGVGQTPESVIMLSSHPPAMLPTSEPESSRTKIDQVPFGSVPTNTASAEPPDGAGAGAGNTSVDASTFVGLYVPVVKCVVGIEIAASSSSVRVMPETSSPPPTSDIIRAFSPPGPTSRMSMSSGNVCVKLLSLTVTL